MKTRTSWGYGNIWQLQKEACDVPFHRTSWRFGVEKLEFCFLVGILMLENVTGGGEWS
jgi:hypothetical protein